MKSSRKKKKVTAILMADRHLRERPPLCRTDNFFLAMVKKLEFIRDLQNKHDCPVWEAGDVFDKWKSSPFLLALALRMMKNVTAIAGQHDLPNHNLKYYDKSSLAVLESAGNVSVIRTDQLSEERFNEYMDIGSTTTLDLVGFPYGTTPHPILYPKIGCRYICLIHELIYQKENPPFPGAEKVGTTDRGIFKRLSGYDLIISGDNHHSFSLESRGRLLVNPGTMLRTKADQADHVPRVALYYEEDNSIKWVELPHEKGVISREHIDEAAERDEHIEAFLEGLTADVEIGLNYRENLERYLDTNNVSNSVREIVWEAVDEGRVSNG